MDDQFNGTLTVAVSPTVLRGNVVLSNASFTDGTSSKALGTGSYPIVGKRAAGAPEYRVGAPEYRVGASASYSAVRLGARLNLNHVAGQQRLFANCTPATITGSLVTSRIPLDSQATIDTQFVAKRRAHPGHGAGSAIEFWRW
ncbi:hypothetical protein [Mycetocola spongiae]|uniref:hypothetical protein n=1 Tax=Mycetocola spongiae TaxID=2859226 RepID=UPI001CF2A743|nr:hypothetical protein [Mycetocola spongiae]UCR89937.1 hypothetical protein KXZ72_04510 [Mycetocola spongiae]